MANNGFFVPKIKAKDFLSMENILSRKRLLSSFTQVPNEVISSDLTDGSVRLYAYLLSKPDNWKIWNADIKKSLRIGSNSTLAKRWKELLDFGLIEREQVIDDKGLFSGGFKYEIFYEINRNTVIENTDELISNRNTLIGNAERLAMPKECTHSNTDSFSNTEKESNTKEYSDDSIEVARYLELKIKIEFSGAKTNSQAWALDIDKAIRIDARTKSELITIIDWIYSDEGSFWKSNVMSGKKLRAKFDTMHAQAQGGNGRFNRNKQKDRNKFMETNYAASAEANGFKGHL